MAEFQLQCKKTTLQTGAAIALSPFDFDFPLDESDLPVINMMSAPGSGKTYLLEKTVEAFAGRLNFAILAGDQEMSYDADRLRKVGAQVKQINTLSSCHLNAEHIEAERDGFISADTQLLVIENVGNLVCPAAFDLGESHKVALLSTSEGEDKPSKYPLLFHEADLIVVTKMDLVPYLEWSQAVCQQHIRNVNSKAPVLYLSAKTGDGMAAWFQYLESLSAAKAALRSTDLAGGRSLINEPFDAAFVDGMKAE